MEVIDSDMAVTEPGNDDEALSVEPETEPDKVSEAVQDNNEKEITMEIDQPDHTEPIKGIDHFIGFAADFEDEIFPKVEHKSKTLYAKVRELESQHAMVIAELLAMKKIPIEVPRHAKGQGGSSVYIEKIIVKIGNEIKAFSMRKTSLRNRKKRVAAGSEGELVIDEGPAAKRGKSKKKAIPNSLSFSQQELQLLRRPLAAGWIRDVVLKSADGLVPGQVSYYSPNGSMIRSYKDLAVSLNHSSGKGLSPANFSFTARPIEGSNNEVVRKSVDSFKPLKDNDVVSKRMIIPRKRRRPGAETSLLNSPDYGSPSALQMQLTSMPDTQKKRRRPRRQPPPKNTLIEKMQVNDSEGGLFGISALSEIFAGMEKDDAERELEEYNRMMSLMAAQENVLEALDHPGSCTVTEDGELLSRDEVLPCSIRCPGMTGKIPGLQCTRCLCLYHAECLGYSDDIDASIFLCPNCEGTDIPNMSPTHSPSKDAMYDFMHKMLEMKSNSPTSVTTTNSPSSFTGFGKGMSIKKVDGGDSSPPPLRRIPSIPQLTSHNLTITPLLPFAKGQIPRMPHLSPMNKFNNNMSVFKRFRGQSNTLLDSQLSPHRNISKQSKQRYPIPNFGASFGPAKPPTSNIFRNYPQSVVSVGQRKFIVVPKSPPPNVMQMFEQPASPKKQSEGFGRQKKFLAEVFNYLTVRDLLKASQVNKAWREEAMKPRLWAEIRLKNTKIHDVDSFGEFVGAHGTHTIDFRKMLGVVSWPDLFTKLSSASTLRTIIVGSKVDDLKELALTHCPRLEVIDSPAQSSPH